MRIQTIDNNNEFDWGLTSSDYGKYRPGYSEEFYDLLGATGIGIQNQYILDIGSGTGVLARAFASRGARVTAVDSSAQQIEVSRALSYEQGLSIEHIISSFEDVALPEAHFEVVSAGQCWQYFDPKIALNKVMRLLEPNGKLVLTYLSWLPGKDKIAAASEDLVLSFNPAWSGAGEQGLTADAYAWPPDTLTLRDFHTLERPIRFTRESWRGRFRACRGIGASLDAGKVTEFDRAHEQMLHDTAPEEFDVLHQLAAYVFTKTTR